jgi:hypothetical protein
MERLAWIAGFDYRMRSWTSEIAKKWIHEIELLSWAARSFLMLKIGTEREHSTKGKRQLKKEIQRKKQWPLNEEADAIPIF